MELTKELLQDLIASKKIADLINIFDSYPDVDLANICNNLDVIELLYIFKAIPNSTSAAVFSYMEQDEKEKIIRTIAEDDLSKIIEHLNADDLVSLLGTLPANMVKDILSRVPVERRKIINQLLKYNENSAGAIMTVEYIELKSELTVAAALENVKKTGSKAETISYCYVINPQRHLIGSTLFRNIFFAESNQKIEDIMEHNPVYVKVHDDREEVARVFKKYDLNALPVVNDDHCLVGIITVDDIIDIIEQEASEDIMKMAKVMPLEDSYLNTNSLTMARKRIVWLLILMISATITGGILEGFEHAFIAYPMLITVIPMFMDTGGNSASQASALIIRGIAVNELKISDWFKVLRKELNVALICGVILAVANFARMILQTLVTDTFKGNGFHPAFDIYWVISLTLIIVVVSAKLLGAALPLIAQKLRMDPAVMAGPLVTTIVDALALIVYFLFAKAILGI